MEEMRRTGIVTRGKIIALAAVLVAFLGITGAAQAAPVPGTPGFMTRASVAPAMRGADDKPEPCFHGSSDCTSSDSTVSLGFHSIGDTSGCKFDLVIMWGDGKPDTKDTVPGGPDGTKTPEYRHAYDDKPGAYSIDWTFTLKSNTGTNNCVNNNGTDVFTLITAGIYADFNKVGDVTQAAEDGWGLIASVDGLACVKKSGRTCPTASRACASRSYVHSTGADLAVERGLSIQASPDYPAWISYWTPAVPAVGAIMFNSGRLAGLKAGESIEAAASMVTRPSTPVYVGLDFEGSPAEISCGNDVRPPHAKKHGDKQCWEWDPKAKQVKNCWIVSPAGWKEFALGWEASILANTSPLALSPAVYVTSNDYKAVKAGGEGVGGWGLPVVIALDPIIRDSVPQGPNIAGYAAFDDPALAPCDNAAEYIREAKDWGGISTIQFSDLNDNDQRVNTVYCKP